MCKIRGVKFSLRTLDVYGWIDTLSTDNNKPRGFKRETLLLDEDRKYGVASVKSGNDSKFIIIDTLQANKTEK